MLSKALESVTNMTAADTLNDEPKSLMATLTAHGRQTSVGSEDFMERFTGAVAKNLTSKLKEKVK